MGNPYASLPKTNRPMYKVKPDTEWLHKLTCEERRKFREKKEQELGLPDGSMISYYEFWKKDGE